MLPDCPLCDARGTLQKNGAEVQGHVWTYCSCCSAVVLVKLKDQEVVRVGKGLPENPNTTVLGEKSS